MTVNMHGMRGIILGLFLQKETSICKPIEVQTLYIWSVGFEGFDACAREPTFCFNS